MNDEASRRHFLGSVGLLTVIAPAAAGEDKQVDRQAQERERVQALGMTEAEAKAWVVTAEAAGAFFTLPELHPMDRQEVATALHVVQNKLLSRPAYRQYLAKAKPEK